jgi:hypothetical protein
MKDRLLISRCRACVLAFLLCLSPYLWAQQESTPKVRVLSIGNSFSRDAFSYVPFIIEDLVPGVEVDWGIMYIGGCSLEKHWNNWVEQKPDYQFDRFRTGDAHWGLQKNVTLQQALGAGEWDIIILQQQSARSRYYDTYQPYLDQLLEVLQKACPNATPAWLMTQAYGTGYERLGEMSSDEMWARINVTSQRVMDETRTRLLIPAGTAIQNARYTALDRFGKAGHLVYDGYHLHEGIAPFIEGLCVAQVVMRHYGVEVDVQKSRLRITPEWRKERRTPEPHGEPEEATEEDYATAMRCAKWALESPWQLTVVEQ